MKKKLLAWLLAGVMAGTVMPLDVSAAEGIRGAGSGQEWPERAIQGAVLGSEGSQGDKSFREGQIPEGSQGLGGEQILEGEQSPGESQNPGGNQTPGENQNPGGEQDPGENQDPGGNQSPGENQTPGENQNPGGEQDPGENQTSGEKQDPGENKNSGNRLDAEEAQIPAENRPGRDQGPSQWAGEDPEPAPSADAQEPADGSEAAGKEYPSGESEAGTGESTAGEAFSGAAGGEAEAQSRAYLERWGVPLDGMDIKYLEVPGDLRAKAKEIDAGSPELLNRQAGIEWDARGSQKYSSAWDTYSSNYLYNHLNAKQKKFWDALDYVCSQYMTKDLNAIPYPYNWGYACPEWKVMYGRMGLTEETARNTFIMFAYSNPQYYFLDSAALPMNSNGEWIMFFYGKFANGLTRKSETARVKAQVSSMGRQIAQGKTEVEKARIAHDLIIKSVKYDHYYKTPYAQSTYHQSAYSVFFEGYTVCAGYSKAFELLMNGAGIDTMAVTSTSHAWNLIRLNDSWYQVDCTWDDKDGANGYEGVYTYFCRKASRIAGDLDQNNFHQMEYFYNKKVPKCTLDSGATLTSIGTYKAPASQVKKPSVSAKKVSGGMQVTIKTATSGASIYYTLDGKTPSPSFSKCYLYTKPFKVSSNVTVKAVAVQNQKWDSSERSVKVKGKMCTVKFNAMGGKKVSSKKVHYSTAVKKPTAKRSGYKFVGWYQDKKCKKAWNFKKKVTKSMTLYAKWKRR